MQLISVKNETPFEFYSLSMATASCIMPSVSSFDSDSDVTSFFIISHELTEQKENYFTLLIYTHCDLENLKVIFFLPKWQESHLSHMGLKLFIPAWVVGRFLDT